ncbi:SDR family oxidoreductase [Candidatus Bathyarchaeota archaeon]|nr:SDR family oxidoreductase [Candidatus Bathyarchaeota archaeon]
MQYTLLGRLEKPKDLSNLIFFLTSEKSSFITGQTITSDSDVYLQS